jgi:hypothetical protein
LSEPLQRPDSKSEKRDDPSLYLENQTWNLTGWAIMYPSILTILVMVDRAEKYRSVEIIRLNWRASNACQSSSPLLTLSIVGKVFPGQR